MAVARVVIPRLAGRPCEKKVRGRRTRRVAGWHVGSATFSMLPTCASIAAESAAMSVTMCLPDVMCTQNQPNAAASDLQFQSSFRAVFIDHGAWRAASVRPAPTPSRWLHQFRPESNEMK